MKTSFLTTSRTSIYQVKKVEIYDPVKVIASDSYYREICFETENGNFILTLFGKETSSLEPVKIQPESEDQS